MAAVPVQGVAITSTSGLIGTQPWAVVNHWQFGTLLTRWTQGDLDLLAATIVTAWVTNFGTLMATNVTVQACTARDLTDNQSLASEHNTAGTPGTRVAQLEPSSLCVMVRYIINSRYRGGHPRQYFPFLGTTDLGNEHTWRDTSLSAVRPAIVAWLAAVQGAAYSVTGNPLQLVVPRYTYTVTDDTVHKKYVRERTGLLRVFQVTDYQPQAPVGSQRRRLTI
jgi:hypothetical protein